MDDNELLFINKNTPFDFNELYPVIKNQFKRITLINKKFNERCTIDIDLQFYDKDKEFNLNNLVIVEVKDNGHNTNSLVKKTLLNMGIQKSGFSKYCIGRAIINSDLKSNTFKPRIRKISRILNEKPNIERSLSYSKNCEFK